VDRRQLEQQRDGARVRFRRATDREALVLGVIHGTGLPVDLGDRSEQVAKCSACKHELQQTLLDRGCPAQCVDATLSRVKLHAQLGSQPLVVDGHGRKLREHRHDLRIGLLEMVWMLYVVQVDDADHTVAEHHRDGEHRADVPERSVGADHSRVVVRIRDDHRLARA
jgi:hypothetical protein